MTLIMHMYVTSSVSAAEKVGKIKKSEKVCPNYWLVVNIFHIQQSSAQPPNHQHNHGSVSVSPQDKVHGSWWGQRSHYDLFSIKRLISATASVCLSNWFTVVVSRSNVARLNVVCQLKPSAASASTSIGCSVLSEVLHTLSGWIVVLVI